MFNLTTNQLTYGRNLFTADASELPGFSAQESITLTNQKTQGTKTFTLQFTRRDRENEVVGWEYNCGELSLVVAND